MRQISLKQYQPNVFFISGLIAAAAIAFWSESSSHTAITNPADFQIPSEHINRIPLAEQRALKTSELETARTAWLYFEHNTDPSTGLVNSVDGFQSTTMWEVGAYIFALIAAERLHLIETKEFNMRANSLLDSLKMLPLFDGKLPNKVYHTQTLAMVTYQNEASEKGLGWSALDMARLLLSLQALREIHPEYRQEVSSLLGLWDLKALTASDRLAGADRLTQDASIRIVQEGRIGYEQYGARSLMRLGMSAAKSASAQSILQWVNLDGVETPADRRTMARQNAINPTTSEPYLLMGLELGWDEESHDLASQIYRAMQRRFDQTGQLTMLSEDHIDQAPHFLYGSVIANETPWEVIDEHGAPHNALRTVSLKASLAWDALLETEYTTAAAAAVRPNGARAKGWIAGLYEQDLQPNEILTLNTNAVVLEALYYKKFGPFLSPHR